MAVEAQTQEEVLSNLVLQEFEQSYPSIRSSLKSIDYTQPNVTRISVHDDWARFHLMSLPQVDGEQSIFFEGGVAHYENEEWNIIFENSEEFDQIESELPNWLVFLSSSHQAQFETENEATSYSFNVPALPWAVGDKRRFNGNLHLPPNGFDFGSLPPGDSNEVFSVDEGEVIYPNAGDLGDTCMIIRRPDGLLHYYQHLDKASINNWRYYPSYVRMGDFLGHTTLTRGYKELCNGPTFGSFPHLHFSILKSFNRDSNGNLSQTPLTGDEYKDSRMNDWIIIDTYGNLKKNNIEFKHPKDQYAQILHSGCPQSRLYALSSSPYLLGYANKNCVGWSWDITTLNQAASPPFGLFSMNVKQGYSALVTSISPSGLSACYDGDLWDMSKDYYPDSNAPLRANVGTVTIKVGDCGCLGATTNSNEQPDNLEGSCPSKPPPPDELPLPPGPNTHATVKIWGYPNFDGPITFSGSEGFSNEPNAEGYSLEIPSGWSVITYRGDNRQGENRCWNGSVANLQDHSDWQTKTQSIQIFEGRDVCRTDPPASSLSQNVQFYNSTNYQNPGPGFSTGFHDRKFFQAGSMKIRDGSSVFLYRWDKRQSEAGAFCFNRNVPSLDAAGWPYEIVGLEVFDTDLCQDELISGYDYLLYKDEGFTGGNCGDSGPVAGQDLTNWCGGDWNDRISSIRIRNGWSIRIWDHANYDESGGSRCFSGSVPTMRNHAFNATGLVIAVYPPENGDRDSRISSFAVFDNEYCDGSPEMPGADWSYHLDNGNLAMGQFVMNANENNNQSIRIEWTASPEYVNGYKIYEHIDDDQYELLDTVGSGVRSWQHNGLPCGTDFHYLVKAYNQWGESASPNLAYASTPTCYVPPTEGPTPNAPTNLHFTNIDQTSISVAWTDNSSIEEVYEVWFQEVPNGTWYNPTLPANSTSKTISNMPCNTEYNFKVRAVRWESGVTYWSESNGVNTFTASCDSLLKPVVTEVTHIGPWEGAEYAIAYADMNSLNGSYTYEWWLSDYPHGDNERSSPANFYTNGGYEFVTGLESCSQYYFRIRAISNGQFRDSDTFVFSVDCPEGPSPNAPTYLDATNTSTTSISVEWEDNSGIEEIHEVWFQEVPNGNWYSTSFFADSIYGTISGLICNTEYNLFIRAVRWEGGVTYWGESNWISAQTKGCPEGPAPNDPTYLDVANTSETSISVEWEDNSGIEEVYEVWYQRVSDGTWNNSSFPADRIYATTTGLACNTEYNLVVRAVRWESGVPYWGESNWANAHTKGCSGGTEIRVLLPIVVSR